MDLSIFTIITDYYYSHLIYKRILDCLIIIHKNREKIGDSTENETSISKESFEKKEQFSNLTSFKLALQGKSGSIVEKFEGKESQITFLPYDLFQNKRILLLIQI
ncbi:MAG TPA: hypothetical protein VJU85_08625, partial [Nitrososphaeraceae archaeon]|nr:hypothetical protein [Nitrososphaeraceae archaeon]